MTLTNTFWVQMAAFNEATLPLQIILIIIALILIYMVFKKHSKVINNLMKVFLAFVFAWNGIVYFLFFAQNQIATFVGAPLFIIVAILFILDIKQNRTHFKLPELKWLRFFTILWIALAFLYPLLGLILGRFYPEICLPMAPCPLTVLAIALVSAAIPDVDKKVYIFLLPWALISLPKCFGVYSCFEDCILFFAGLYGLIILIKNWKNIT
ncbi:MAG: DUF6064 family protein [Methanomicrobiales archaeon]